MAPAWAASPTSSHSSNINPGDAASTIAPQLPTPAAGEDNTPRQFLIAARQAIAAGRTGEAQEALERAETRLLDRSTPLFRTDEAARGPLIRTISEARQALGTGDRMRAEQLTGQALATLGPPR
ncbi:MAG: hypothetical protein ACREF3_17700 [Acetobacteraceae bacterium]